MLYEDPSSRITKQDSLWLLIPPSHPQTATWTCEAPQPLSPQPPRCPCSLMFWTCWPPWTAAAGPSLALRAWMTFLTGMSLGQSWTPYWTHW